MPLPLPRVVADVGPGGGIPTAMNALNQNAITASQAQYAPYNNYANALSKIAYAQYVGPQAIASIMQSPSFWLAAQKNPQLVDNLLRNLNGALPNNNAMVNLPRPSGGLLGTIIDKLRGTNSNQNPSPPGNALNNAPQPPNTSGQNFGANNQAPPSMVNDIAQNGNNSYQTPGAPQVAGSATGLPEGSLSDYPLAQLGAANEAAKTQAEKNAQANFEGAQEDAKASEAAQELKNQAEAFHYLYNKKGTSFTGPLSGQINPTGPVAGIINSLGIANAGPAQNLDNLSSNMMLSLGDNGKFRQLAGPELNFIKGVKVDRKMTPDAELNTYNQLVSTANRTLERQPFNQALIADPIKASRQERNTLWSMYNKALPPFDKKQNQTPTGLWRYWATPEAVNAIRQGNTSYKPEGWNQVLQKAQAHQNDLIFTAKKYGMTVQEVKRRLGED